MAKIYLDPGHGGSDSGAVGNGLREKDVVLSIAKHARDYLQKNYSGVSIRMSRTGDTFPTLAQRASDANNWNADVFVSFHINAGGGKGYEDFVFNGSISDSTAKLQNALHKELAPMFQFNRGKKRANFAVLRLTKMPAVLTECGFIDNKTDANFLKSDANLRKLGEAHAKGIAAFLGLKRKSTQSDAKGEIYRVRSSWSNAKSQKGAFKSLASAKEAANKHGYNVYDSKGKLVHSGKKKPAASTKSKYVEVLVNDLWTYNKPDWKAKHKTVKKGEVFTIKRTITVAGAKMHELKSGVYITNNPKYVRVFTK